MATYRRPGSTTRGCTCVSPRRPASRRRCSARRPRQSGDLKIFEILITYAQVLLKTETPDQVLTFNLQDYRKVLATGTTQVNEDGTFFMQVPPYANPL